MKISLITPTYNSEKTISRTIDSIVAQNYSNLEYIIVDGASSDRTLEIVKGYQGEIDIKLISEPDRGLYDAMNKGIKMATGEIIGILNSDDLFKSDNVLSLVAESFADNNVDAVYGDITYFADNEKVVKRYWHSGVYSEGSLNNGWTIPHPALYLRKSVYDRFGLFNTNFKIAGDYEFILRLLKKHKINLKYLPHVFVNMYEGGISGRNLEQRRKGWAELKKAWVVNGFKVPNLFILRRVLFKISQIIFK